MKITWNLKYWYNVMIVKYDYRYSHLLLYYEFVYMCALHVDLYILVLCMQTDKVLLCTAFYILINVFLLLVDLINSLIKFGNFDMYM